MSECCSCNTMRGEDYGDRPYIERSFNADCQQDQTNASDGVDYVMGTMVCMCVCLCASVCLCM